MRVSRVFGHVGQMTVDVQFDFKCIANNLKSRLMCLSNWTHQLECCSYFSSPHTTTQRLTRFKHNFRCLTKMNFITVINFCLHPTKYPLWWWVNVGDEKICYPRDSNPPPGVADLRHVFWSTRLQTQMMNIECKRSRLISMPICVRVSHTR